MIALLLWCLLFVLCWPLALFALLIYPFVWLMLLPFRLVGIAVEGAGAGVGARNISCAIAQRPVSSFQNLREAATFAERKSELELHRL
jgi:hypothetical protein